jgi:DtxR family manganese transport transcriptional regulator
MGYNVYSMRHRVNSAPGAGPSPPSPPEKGPALPKSTSKPVPKRRPTTQGPVPAPRDPAAQAAGHQRTRQARAGEIAQDYAEAIADLIDAGGEARVTDLARCLGVTHVTVNRTVARLQRDGLVSARPYRSIFLTDAGRALAATARRRHVIVLAFLRCLGVSEQTAQTDAEGIEHHVSEETLAAMARFARQARA